LPLAGIAQLLNNLISTSEDSVWQERGRLTY